jgi:dipeptidyl aminopeptidase/acylaminoacyl peptidase
MSSGSNVSFAMKWWVTAPAWIALFVGGGLRLSQEPAIASEKHPVTVADTIAMTRIAGTPYPYFSPKNRFAVFSPNGMYFAIVVAKGDLNLNVNDYSLLVFRAAKLSSQTAIPRKLATFSSSSNRSGISEVRWLKDNDTILFLGSRGTAATQLYWIQRSSGVLKELTSHRTSLLSYSASENGETIVFAAERAQRDLASKKILRYGLEVGSEKISDLVRGKIADAEPQLFLKGAESAADELLSTPDPIGSGEAGLSLSPNGRYLVLKTDTTDVPENWRQYNDYAIQTVFRRTFKKGFRTGILRYQLMDIRTHRTQALIDAPTTYASEVLWAPDSRSLVVCGTYLSLNVKDPAELAARRAHSVVVEIRLPSGEIKKVTSEQLKPIRWDPQTNLAEFTSASQSERDGDTSDTVYYRNTGKKWEKLVVSPKPRNDARPEVFTDEGLNVVPRICALDGRTKRQVPLMDLNPQFAQLALGKEELISWTIAGGTSMSGGLYFPPNYVAGRRYPLVIQTHGFDPHRFWIDGPYSSAFAAQPLASRGIVVLQINDSFHDATDTPNEAEGAMRAYESAIDYLDGRGIIDHDRVGLIGFSRTCLYVKYALTHSIHHFAAAVVSDGVDAGYLQYLLFYNVDPGLALEFESIVGSAPFGAGLSPWLKDSPGFLLDRVQTPVLIQAIGPDSILGEWQWFVGLKRLEKPVDLVYLPEGTHVLVKPWERMVSQEGSVDWFAFWLDGEENEDPLKAEQYSRWRGLRSQAAASSHR